MWGAGMASGSRSLETPSMRPICYCPRFLWVIFISPIFENEKNKKRQINYLLFHGKSFRPQICEISWVTRMKVSPRRNDEGRKMVLTFYTLHAMSPDAWEFSLYSHCNFLLLFSKLCHNTVQIYSTQVVCPLAFFPRLSWQNITGLDGRQRSTIFLRSFIFLYSGYTWAGGNKYPRFVVIVHFHFFLFSQPFPLKRQVGHDEHGIRYRNPKICMDIIWNIY